MRLQPTSNFGKTESHSFFSYPAFHGYGKGPRIVGEALAGTMLTEEPSSRKVPPATWVHHEVAPLWKEPSNEFYFKFREIEKILVMRNMEGISGGCSFGNGRSENLKPFWEEIWTLMPSMGLVLRSVMEIWCWPKAEIKLQEAADWKTRTDRIIAEVWLASGATFSNLRRPPDRELCYDSQSMYNNAVKSITIWLALRIHYVQRTSPTALPIEAIKNC